MRTVLDIENVSKSYKLGKTNVPVLKDINLAINKGEFAAIMGPSGSGKNSIRMEERFSWSPMMPSLPGIATGLSG